MILKAALTYRNPQKAEPYAEALRQAGIEPVLLAPSGRGSLDGLQGLLLSGGTDINPARYGGALHPANEPADDERDELEGRLLKNALDRDLPILAICRGMQLFNVVHGGTLVQHLPNAALHRVRGDDPGLPAHEIVVEPGSRLAAIMGPGVHAVNSRHHQGIDRAGAGLRVSARSARDGIIEALERPDRGFALAVQWHPEDQAGRDPIQARLFEAFALVLSGTRVG